MKPVLFLFSALIGLTAQVRLPGNRLPSPAVQIGEGAIEGSVVDAVTREPVKKASVNLNGSPNLSAVTDTSGRFAFRKLPAGRYVIQAQSERHPPRPNGIEMDRQVTVTLSAGEQKRDLALLLTPGGTLRGRIVDEEGTPMQPCQVTTMQFRDMGFGRTLAGGGSFGQSDSDGEYRLSNVPAGRYYVSARCGQTIPLPHALMRQDSLDRPMLTYPARFYPGTPDVSGAAKIEVLPGADVAGIDFRMSPSTGVRVRGRAGPPLWTATFASHSNRRSCRAVIYSRARGSTHPLVILRFRTCSRGRITSSRHNRARATPSSQKFRWRSAARHPTRSI